MNRLATLPRSRFEGRGPRNLTAKQQYIIDAFGGQLYLNDELDVQTGKLWDSIAYLGGDSINTQNSMLFTNVEAGSGKTHAETNCQCNRRLLAPESFAIERITLTFNRTSSNEDVFTIAENAVFNFSIGQKRYIQQSIIAMHSVECPAPIRTCDFCRAVYVQDRECPGCGARSFTLSDRGVSSRPGLQFSIDLPLRLLINQASFYASFDLRSYVVKQPLKLWCHLEGLYARGVQ